MGDGIDLATLGDLNPDAALPGRHASRGAGQRRRNGARGRAYRASMAWLNVGLGRIAAVASAWSGE